MGDKGCRKGRQPLSQRAWQAQLASAPTHVVEPTKQYCSLLIEPDEGSGLTPGANVKCVARHLAIQPTDNSISAGRNICSQAHLQAAVAERGTGVVRPGGDGSRGHVGTEVDNAEPIPHLAREFAPCVEVSSSELPTEALTPAPGEKKKKKGKRPRPTGAVAKTRDKHRKKKPSNCKEIGIKMFCRDVIGDDFVFMAARRSDW